MDLVSIIKYVKKADGEKMNLENIKSTCIWSRSEIQSTQSRFKVTGFTNSKRK